MTQAVLAPPTIAFEQGLPGFEAHQQFVLLASTAVAPFTLLQGEGPDAPSFVAIDPRRVDPQYQIDLDADDLARLDAAAHQSLLWLVLVTARPDGSATVNLRAPIAINPASMKGIQVLSLDETYPLEHLLIQG